MTGAILFVLVMLAMLSLFPKRNAAVSAGLLFNRELFEPDEEPILTAAIPLRLINRFSHWGILLPILPPSHFVLTSKALLTLACSGNKAQIVQRISFPELTAFQVLRAGKGVRLNIRVRIDQTLWLSDPFGGKASSAIEAAEVISQAVQAARPELMRA